MDLDAPTVTGQTWGERLADTANLSAAGVKDNPIVLTEPRRSFSGIDLLRSNVWESAVVKISGMTTGQLADFDDKVGVVLFFENESAKGTIIGPHNTILIDPKPVTIDFVVHRDKQANAAVIEIQRKTIILKEGQWSKWLKLDFEFSKPGLNKDISGICRFYLQEVSPNFRMYVTPINTDPSDPNPASPVTEPPEFIEQISKKLGLFYTTGFQADV